MTAPVPRISGSARRVHRVGRRPDPWAWTPWQYAPFNGRWDDPDATYRVIYTGASLYGCLLEVLAIFRPDPKLLTLYAELEEVDNDSAYPNQPAGTVPSSWVARREVGVATLTGRHVQVAIADTIAWLRSRVPHLLVRHGIGDLDGGTIRAAQPRAFTRDLSRWLYEFHDENGVLAGIAFESRHGSGLRLWATFERHGDDAVSRHLTHRSQEPLSESDRTLRRALEHHGLALERA